MLKKKPLSAGLAFVIAILAAAGFAPAQRYEASSSAQGKMTVLNPAVASRMAERVPLTPRSATLDDKTIYMVNINWGGSEAARSVFEEMQAWFSQNMTRTKTIIRLKRGGYDADDPALWKEIARSGNAAIIGISG
jgi:hypothetical protein